MTKLKKIVGSYDHILRQSYCPQEFIDGLLADNEYEKTLGTILGDLSRGAFFETNTKTFDDLIETWINPSISTSYNQGNINASFFNQIILRYLESDNFLGSNEWRTEENYSNYYAKKTMVKLSFAYFDDKGIPCGVMFHGSRFDPDTWAVAVIRNTTAAPNEREVMVLCSADVMQKEAVSATSDAKTFDDFLQSDEISQALQGVFLENNQLNFEKIDALKERLSRIPEAKKEQLIRQRSQLETLVRNHFQQTEKNNDQQAINKLNQRIEQLQGNVSFIRRQPLNMIGASLALMAAMSLLLAVSGVLAPLGIVFAASMVSYGLIASVGLSIISVGFIANIVRSERSLFEARQDILPYQQHLASLENKQKSIIEPILHNNLDDGAFNAYRKSLAGPPLNTHRVEGAVLRRRLPVVTSTEYERGFGVEHEDDVDNDDTANSISNRRQP